MRQKVFKKRLTWVLCSFGSKLHPQPQWWTAGEKVMAFPEHCSLKVALVVSFFQSTLLSHPAVCAFYSLCLLPSIQVWLWLVAEWTQGLYITWSGSSWCSEVPVFSSELPSFSLEPEWQWWPHRTLSSGPSGLMLNTPHSNMHQSGEKERTDHWLKKK